MYVLVRSHLGENEAQATGTMMTRIFHPNVSKAGEICVDTLKKSWNKKYGVGHVLVVRALSYYVYCVYDVHNGRRELMGRR